MLDQLRLDLQLDELAALKDGWLDGDGVAPDRVGLKWFGAQFADLLTCQRPTFTQHPRAACRQSGRSVAPTWTSWLISRPIGLNGTRRVRRTIGTRSS